MKKLFKRNLAWINVHLEKGIKNNMLKDMYILNDKDHTSHEP